MSLELKIPEEITDFAEQMDFALLAQRKNINENNEKAAELKIDRSEKAEREFRDYHDNVFLRRDEAIQKKIRELKTKIIDEVELKEMPFLEPEELAQILPRDEIHFRAAKWSCRKKQVIAGLDNNDLEYNKVDLDRDIINGV